MNGCNGYYLFIYIYLFIYLLEQELVSLLHCIIFAVYAWYDFWPAVRPWWWHGDRNSCSRKQDSTYAVPVWFKYYLKKIILIICFLSFSRDMKNIPVSIYQPHFCSKNLLIGFIDLYNGKTFCLTLANEFIVKFLAWYVSVCVCVRSILVRLTLVVATVKGLQSLSRTDLRQSELQITESLL